MKALNDVIDGGKVRYIGASSVSHFVFRKRAFPDIRPNEYAPRPDGCNGWHRFVSMQSLRNLIARQEEREMIPYCLDTEIGLTPWSPIARGVLARAWDSRSSIRESTDGSLKSIIRDRESAGDKAIIDIVEEVAKGKGITMAQVAIVWCLAHPNENPILSLNSQDRIDEAVAAISVQLTEEEIRYLEELYVPKQIHPSER
ncbi:hypothetical protein N7478_009147 [Penicillium angulare]|uniref:uncharacterized protein n=1 Tax=Penicillium angulare TaxID=116970 RepID=UPI002541872F|nr:uncharacterized protein N7478_009147 [Penicillium angulare]KAJ5274022.1 hypothetical protein N7478_009147 [Penicillium angulare]